MFKFVIVALSALVACAAGTPGLVAPFGSVAYANAPLYAAGGSSQVDVRNNFDGTLSSYTTAPFNYAGPLASRYVSGIPPAPFAAAAPAALPFAAPAFAKYAATLPSAYAAPLPSAYAASPYFASYASPYAAAYASPYAAAYASPYAAGPFAAPAEVAAPAPVAV